MSLTTRKLTTSLYLLTANGSVSGATTKLSIVFNASSTIYGVTSKNGIAIYVDGVKQSPTWTVNATADFMGTTKYTKLTSSTFSISKPFFEMEITADGSTVYEDTFSFYEIEKAGSTISATGGIMDGSTMSTVTYTTTASDATYSTKFQLESYSNTVTSSAKTTSYAIPVSWCNALPDDIYGSATITGSVLFGGKVYKSFSTTLRVIVPSTVVPSISAMTFTDSDSSPVPSSWGVYVQNQSGLQLKTLTCAGAYGSSIETVKLTADGKIKTADYPSFPQIDKITQSGSVSVMVTITDSRGRSTYMSTTVPFVAYSLPKLSSVKSERCKADGTIDNDGMYFLSTTTATFASCSGKNSISLTVQYKRTDLRNYINEKTITPGSNVCGENDLDPEYSYDILYTLTDEFNTVTYSDYVSTAVYLMHFLHGGRGVAFGQKATKQDTLDCNFDAIFRKKLSCVLDDGTTLEVRDLMEKIQNNLVDLLCPQNKLPGKLLNLLYPIGSIYISTSAVNPTTIMGGTWVAWGAGRMPLGVGDNGKTSYIVSEVTGGSPYLQSHTHTFTTGNNSVGHTHTFTTGNQSANHTHSLSYNSDSGAQASGSDPSGRGAFVRRTASGGSTSTWSTGNQSASHTHSGTTASQSANHTHSGTTATHNQTVGDGQNMPPYITCYMWKRTA